MRLLCLHIFALLLQLRPGRSQTRNLTRAENETVSDNYARYLRILDVETPVKQDATFYKNISSLLIGATEDAAFTRNSALGKLLFAYHFNVPGIREGLLYHYEINRNLRRVRDARFSTIYNKVVDFRKEIGKRYRILTSNNSRFTDRAAALSNFATYGMERGSYYHLDHNFNNSTKFIRDAQTSTVSAMHVFILSLIYSVIPIIDHPLYLPHFDMIYNDVYTSVQGTETTADAASAHIDMLLKNPETLQIGQARQKELKSIIANVKTKTSEYGKTYHDVGKDGGGNRYKNHHRKAVDDFRKAVISKFCTPGIDSTDWRSWFFNEFEPVRGEQDYNKTKKTIAKFFKSITEVFKQITIQAKLPPKDREWKYVYNPWNEANTNETSKNINWIHNLVVGWDKVDELNEYFKFIANLTYWDNKRIDLIRDAQTYIRDPNRKLYMSISPTHGDFCYHNESDLVSTCTRENNEICAPMPLSRFEKTNIDAYGGWSILRPKTAFVLNPKTSQFVRRKTYVIKFHTCQCGFRTDCGSDLGTKINCVFQTNDNIRKQCRGSIGYPCKTHPLAPGKHHESCVTRFCNMEANSCEKGPQKIYEMDNGSNSNLFGVVNFFIVAVIMHIF